MAAAGMLERSGMRLYLSRQGFLTQAPCRNRRQTATCRVQVMNTFNLIKSLSRHHLVRIMKERTRAFFFLRAFPCEKKHIRVILKWRPSTKLIEEHAVLLAPVLILQNDVNAPVLSVGDRLPVRKNMFILRVGLVCLVRECLERRKTPGSTSSSSSPPRYTRPPWGFACCALLSLWGLGVGKPGGELRRPGGVVW